VSSQPLVDIDIEGETSLEDAETISTPDVAVESSSELTNSETLKETQPERIEVHQRLEGKAKPFLIGKNGTLATPAVRHLSNELGIDIGEVTGTGKDGRVLKEDLQKFASVRESQESSQPQLSPRQGALTSDKVIPITGIRAQMFKSMTRSLSIPHFLYTSPVDFTSLTSMRSRIHESSGQKFSPLPFIIKAVSLALQEFPALNAHLDPTSNADKPNLTHKAAHNFAIAIDSPHGLVVPVIHNVQDLSISAISAKVSELAGRARANKLSPIDFTGATFTISNIGSIGGGAVAPVIATPQVAILGVGRSRAVAIWDDKEGRPARREECVFSWSADHRVVDGAVVARAGERVRALLEEVGSMVLDLR
jgi:2-oxoisovalerate dehydrogenase E2 component (dihydrolipoyl transacylase)